MLSEASVSVAHTYRLPLVTTALTASYFSICYVNIILNYACLIYANFSGRQLGRKTRASCTYVCAAYAHMYDVSLWTYSA